MRDSRYDVLFEPVRIGPKVAPNRFYQVPHCAGSAGSEQPGFQSELRGMKAQGGWGVVCTEYCSIHPTSDDSPYVSARLWDDDDAANLSVMCDRIHDFGSLAGAELWHGGFQSKNSESRHVRIGPLQGPSDLYVGNYARYADAEDIVMIQGWYVDAAIRARQAGFDVVYVYAAHNELPTQFLSPFFNHRHDQYGGSFENRARFWRETLEKVKEAVGDDCAIATRLSVDTLQGGKTGYQVGDDGIRFVEHVDHLVDLWDLTIGSTSGAEWGNDAGPSRFLQENHEKDYVGQIKMHNHTDKPVVGVGRITNPDTMVEIIKSRQFDFIGAARPSIADPFLPKKIDEGRLDEIRECIGCNQCVASHHLGGATHIQCTQNATIGEEYRRGWHPEIFTPARNRDMSVLVLGAGPAGMEAAVVLGKRQMEAVHLREQNATLGGALNWITKLGYSDGADTGERWQNRGLAEWGRVTDYREIQLAKLSNVETHLNAPMTAADVLDYGAELVIIATGARYATDGTNAATHAPIPGVDTTLDWQATPPEIVTGTKTPGQRVLIYDCEDYFVGVSIAQMLASQGHDVTIATPHAVLAEHMNSTLEGGFMRRDLRRLGVRILTETTVEEVRPGAVITSDIWQPKATEEHQVDTVVMASARVSNDGVYRELRSRPDDLAEAGISGLYVVGSANAPGMIINSVFQGHRLAREIDSEDPMDPLPFIRERRLWGRVDNSRYEAALDGLYAAEQAT
jgi:dimethylamine/trimethylamine dehydrogenase